MITVEVKTQNLQRALQKLGAQIADRRAVNKLLSLKLFAMVMENFERESHDGKPWVELTPSTRRWKQKHGYEKILQNTGALRQSFLPFAEQNVAGVGAQAMASRVAGDPGKTARPYDMAKHHEEGIGVPARPMLPGRGRALEEALNIYGHFLYRAKQGVGL